MGFIKYSVVTIGIEDDLPGWIKQSSQVNLEDANNKESKLEASDEDVETSEASPQESNK